MKILYSICQDISAVLFSHHQWKCISEYEESCNMKTNSTEESFARYTFIFLQYDPKQLENQI